MKSTLEKPKVKKWNREQRKTIKGLIEKSYFPQLFDTKVMPTRITIQRRPE